MLKVLVMLGAFLWHMQGSTGIVLNPDVRALIVGEGNSQTLQCSVTTNTRVGELYWDGPGITRDSSVSSNVSNSDGSVTYTATITISPRTSEETYTCNHRPLTGTDETREIKIYRGFETKTEAEFFYKNETGTLACSLMLQGVGVGVTFSGWYKDDQALQSLTEEERKRFSEFDNGTLVIQKPTREDTGVYVANYSITGLREVSSYSCEVIYRSTPLVLDFSKSRNIQEEEDLDIICKIIGYPKSNVTWRLGDQVLLPDDKHIFMEDIDGHINSHLIIKSLSVDDEGKYVCTATNSANESDEKSVLVRVTGRLAWLWPLIGIFGEALVLVVIILLCEKFRKNEEKESAHTD